MLRKHPNPYNPFVYYYLYYSCISKCIYCYMSMGNKKYLSLSLSFVTMVQCYILLRRQVMNKPVCVLRTVEKVSVVLDVLENMPHLHSGFPVVKDFNPQQVLSFKPLITWLSLLSVIMVYNSVALRELLKFFYYDISKNRYTFLLRKISLLRLYTYPNSGKYKRGNCLKISV